MEARYPKGLLGAWAGHRGHGDALNLLTWQLVSKVPTKTFSGQAADVDVRGEMEAIKSIIKTIKKWYHGQYLPHPPVSSVHCNIPIEQITHGYFKRPALIRVLIYMKQFWKKHWKILLPIVVALLAIFFQLFV